MPRFSEKAQRALLDSGCVKKITDTQVSFTTDFKVQAVCLNLDGLKSRRHLFFVGNRSQSFCFFIPQKTISRWKKIFLNEGEDGLKQEKRGKRATGRPKKTFDKNDIKSLQERDAYLEAETFVKLLEYLEVDSTAGLRANRRPQLKMSSSSWSS